MKVLHKINPPKNIDDLRKKFGVGKYRDKKSSIRKKLVRLNQLTENPFFSFKEDGNTKKLCITYTTIIPSKNEKGVFIRDNLGNPKMKKSPSKPHYCNDFKLPFDKNTFEYFVKYVINFQKELRKEERETLNMYSSSSPMIEVFVDDFLKNRKSYVLPKTYYSYEKVLSYFIIFIKRNNNPPPPYIFNKYQIERIRKDNPQLNVGLDTDFSTHTKIEEFEGIEGKQIILNWINQLQKKSVDRKYGGISLVKDETKPSTIKSYWVVIRCFFNWLSNNRWIKENPIRYITQRELPQFSHYETLIRQNLTPTDFDIEKIYEWILKERDNPPNVGRWVNQKRKEFGWLLPMLIVWMKSGVRNQTLCDLELKNVDWKRKTIKYKSKFDKMGEIYIDEDLEEWLKPFIINPQTNEVFTNRKWIFENKKGKPYNPNSISTYFLKIRKEIKEKYPQFNEKITIHSFRRYFINKGLRLGLPLSLVRKSVNHSSYNTLLKYETDLILDEDLSKTTLPTPNLEIDDFSKDEKIREINQQIEELKKELEYIDGKS